MNKIIETMEYHGLHRLTVKDTEVFWFGKDDDWEICAVEIESVPAEEINEVSMVLRKKPKIYCPVCGIEVTDEHQKNIPKGDRVSVVRCKDCKHARVHDYAPAECPYYCSIAVNYHTKDFFCSLGERREDGEIH